MIDVTLLGTGGMMPLPDRYLTSLYVRSDGRAVLIDCGEGTQTAIRSASLRFKCIEALLITHYHADHVSGLPGLLLTLGNEGRELPLHIYGPVGLARVVSAARVIVSELKYEIILHEIDNAPICFEAAGFIAEAIPAEHGMPCLFYKLSLPRAGKFDPAAAKAKNIPLRLWAQLQAGNSVEGFTPDDVLGKPRRGLSLVYATDTRPVDMIAQAGYEADLMILEGMFGEEEKRERALETHHMTMQEAADLACRANARELWLTHFSPATPHPEEFQETICSIFENTIMGTDGMSATLRFDD